MGGFITEQCIFKFEPVNDVCICLVGKLGKEHDCESFVFFSLVFKHFEQFELRHPFS